MESSTFRKWLAERGCRFDQHPTGQGTHGIASVTAHREGRKAVIPLWDPASGLIRGRSGKSSRVLGWTPLSSQARKAVLDYGGRLRCGPGYLTAPGPRCSAFLCSIIAEWYRRRIAFRSTKGLGI
jgi:hypothetical protein